MGNMQIWLRGNLGNFLFGLWLIMLALFQPQVLNMIQFQWVNVLLGLVLIAAGVCHIVDF